MRILDPACGSGSFLLSAYTYLLNNIFGVDIDSQAVEVTKLSLLLKVLKGENRDTVENQFRIFHERALPDLGNNIKCGNSLIGPDFHDDKDPDSIDPEEYRRINPFDYKTEFPQIFSHKNLGAKQRSAEGGPKADGFNAVIGNPPYVRVRHLKTDNPVVAAYLESKYRCAIHVWDVYLLFFEKALSLVGPKGLVSFIVPIQTLHQPNCESLRKILVNETAIIGIANLSQVKVFQKPIVKN